MIRRLICWLAGGHAWVHLGHLIYRCHVCSASLGLGAGHVPARTFRQLWGHLAGQVRADLTIDKQGDHP